MTEEQIQQTAFEIAVTISSVQCETGDPPGWEFDRVTYVLANYFKRALPGFNMAAFRATCNIYSTPVAGACDDDNPTCGKCFACEAKADDDHWWEVNREAVCAGYYLD